MNKDFHKELELAKKLILQANDIATQRFLSNPTIRLKADKSFVTETDEELEAFFRREFEKEFPQHGFIGEEGTPEIKEYNWIIDPIDGTTAFARGLAEFSIVLAFVSHTETLFSVIYRPLLNELYYAYSGEGAFKNDQQISVSQMTDFSQAVISFTPQCFSKEKYREYSLNLCRTNHLRITHSSGVESTLLSQGSIDVLIKFEQPIWDTAAECLLMQEAGAVISNEFGDPLQLDYSQKSLHNWIATNPAIHTSSAKSLYWPKT